MLNNELNNLDYITTFLSENSEHIKKIHKKVKHGKLRVQRKKVKSQVLKDSKPRDYKREGICKNARKKAHTSVSNAKRNISNSVRKSLKEGLQVVNPKAMTLSEAFNFDFIEEAMGWDLDIEFFEKPQVTPVSEGLDIGTTKTGRPRKCKAIGIAEGVFAPIEDAEGNSVFSRNNRLYESDHWVYQLENQNLVDRVNSRRMLGTIGHEDKKVDDQDLREGKVSHIVTNLEIREDEENGRYLWGRLEILNTPAGRLLKEYYDNDIPLFVSSRGGGKLLDVPGKNYKVVDKSRYFCECFDVVKEPGFLEACPQYHNESDINTLEQLTADVERLVKETSLQLVSESVEHSNEVNEDNNMEDSVKKLNVSVEDSAEEMIKKLVLPLAENMKILTETVKKMQADIYESEEAPVEEVAEEVKAEEKVEEPVVEATAEEAPEAVEEPAQEEAPAEVTEEKVEEPATEVTEEKCPNCGKEKCDCKKEKEDDAEEKKCDCKESEEPAVEVVEEKKEEKEDEKAEGEEEKKEEKEEKCDCKESEEKVENTEVVEEQWADKDPKETAPEISKLPDAPVPGPAAPADIKDSAWAAKDPKETAPEKSAIADAQNAPCEHEDDAKEEKPAVADAVIKEEAEEAAEEVPAGMEQVTDYKAMYEGLEAEVKEATNTINEMIETFKDFGKKYQEIVLESKGLQEQLDAAKKELNSYKLNEKFNVTVETANEMLGSKSMETVEEELKEAEAKQEEAEAQAKVEQVSESIKPEVKTAEAPVSRKRKAYSAFSAAPQGQSINESQEERPKRKTFSWFN